MQYKYFKGEDETCFIEGRKYIGGNLVSIINEHKSSDIEISEQQYKNWLKLYKAVSDSNLAQIKSQHKNVLQNM